MAKIHSISIKNFRAIKNFEQTFPSDFICLIGRGDSGKSSILEAISCVLSPNWNIAFHDNDFFNCNTGEPIEIEVTIREVPPSLMTDKKFGLYQRGLDISTGEVKDELEEEHESVLTIRLVVEKDLEPKWFVINEREADAVPISAHDRGQMNMFMVSDYIDRHFSWNKGNPLYSLLKQELEEEGGSEDDDAVIDAMRGAKATIDGHGFAKFDNVVSKIKASALKLGVNISKTKSTIDSRDINIKDGKLCLHDTNVPFRLKGKGSKRLISIAIQTAVAEQGAIILVDELEQGLEPDRAQHLAATLKSTTNGQVFITTHSRDVLVELDTTNLFMMKSGAKKLTNFEPSLQGCLRKNPEAFFAHKVIVCEGATEVGICRALNKYRISNGKENAAFVGVRFADGSGHEQVAYSEGFKKSGFPVCLFCDSDRSDINAEKTRLQGMGIEIVDWESNDCLETAIVKYLPFNLVNDFVSLAASIEHEEDSTLSLVDIIDAMEISIAAHFKNISTDAFQRNVDSPNLRRAIGIAAHKKDWFKSQSKGEKLGTLIFDNYAAIEQNKLKERFETLSSFIA